eukprot:SAG31_NODE_2342_length_5912_cov_1.363152_2_plen_107_part_00
MIVMARFLVAPRPLSASQTAHGLVSTSTYILQIAITNNCFMQLNAPIEAGIDWQRHKRLRRWPNDWLMLRFRLSSWGTMLTSTTESGEVHEQFRKVRLNQAMQTAG